MDFSFGILHQHLEVAAILIFVADALGVLFEFGRVVGLGKYILEKDGMRYADGLQVLHGRPQGPAVDIASFPETYAADLDLRAFFYHEGDSYRSRWNWPDFRADGSELPAVFREQFPDRDFSLLDTSWDRTDFLPTAQLCAP